MHVAAGFAISVPAAIVLKVLFQWFPLSVVMVLELLLVIFVSSLSPDLDHENGFLHNTLIMLGLIVAVAGLFEGVISWVWIGVLVAAGAFFVAKWAHHRGMIHSIPFCILFGVLVAWGLHDAQLGVLSVFGSWSHLMMDKIPFKMW